MDQLSRPLADVLMDARAWISDQHFLDVDDASQLTDGQVIVGIQRTYPASHGLQGFDAFIFDHQQTRDR
jgi:hypothetical protein